MIHRYLLWIFPIKGPLISCHFSMYRIIVLKEQYQQVISSKASVPMHMKGIRNFVVLHFQMSAHQKPVFMRIMKITKKRRMSMKFHGLYFPFFLVIGSLQAFGEFAVLWWLRRDGDVHISNFLTMYKTRQGLWDDHGVCDQNEKNALRASLHFT